MDDRIAQMMRVMEALHGLGLSVADSLTVLKAFYDEPTSALVEGDNE